MTDFNPNQPGFPGNIFGLPCNLDEAEIVLLPVPWDVTVSYDSGTANGPRAILNASPQIDYSIPKVHKPWQLKIYLDEILDDTFHKSQLLRADAERYIEWIEQGDQTNTENFSTIREKINVACAELENQVNVEATRFLDQNKLVGCVGGDHSTPLGLINALANRYDQFGILQIDAHMDLHKAYEGFEYSHASIMLNALKNENISKLVQVGIRDYCEEESDYTISSQGRITTFYDQKLKEALFTGSIWENLAHNIIDLLPDLVYISFDIDGLEPSMCPNTGTPVPGGLAFNEATFLIEQLVRSGRKLIGFDLSEVSPGDNEWDANVGSRILYQLCVYTGLSQGKLKFEG